MRQIVANAPLVRMATAAVLLLIGSCAAAETVKQRVTVSLSQSRAEPGQTVSITITATKNRRPFGEVIHAVVLKPSVGPEPLSLHRVSQREGLYSASILLPDDAPQGLYVIDAWIGNDEHPSAVGKASFLSGKLIGDFFIASALDKAHPATDLNAYLDDFHRLGGNFLIAHNLITPDGPYFSCRVCKRHIGAAQEDIVEILLSQADKRGYAVLLSVSWDMTREAPYDLRMGETKKIMAEIFRRYSRHASFAGFYSFQEGSGTYYVPYIREFSRYAKTLDSSLLVACAPYIDDPLLAGYLSTLKDLDVIIWQSGVMGSYRPDNRKEYPARRVKDFCSLAAGAKQLQGKIALTHVELFGYLEQRLVPDIPTTGYNNIYEQVLSAATVRDGDGIMLFTYHYHIYNVLKKHPEAVASRKAVVDGLTAFNLIASHISNSLGPVALYFPYSDWVVERWSSSFLPALDAFRVLGIPVDVLPYAPPLAESLLPYYPIHMNQAVLARLLKARTVLVLPDVSGFQQTDSDLMKSFVEQGGTLIAFGPQIPMGRSYERRELFGGEPLDNQLHSSIIVEDAFGNRVSTGKRIELQDIHSPSWVAGKGKVIAKFEDGSGAILVNSYAKGKTITILPSASDAAREFPELVRDAIDYALENAGTERAADLLGTDARMDVAAEKLRDGFAVAVVNHNPVEKDVTVCPLRPHLEGGATWIDSANGTRLPASDQTFLKLRIPAKGFRAIEFKQKVSAKGIALPPKFSCPEPSHE